MKKSYKIKLLVSAVITFAATLAISIGVAFAWYFQNVSSKGNKIASGSVKVQVLKYDELSDEYVDISESTDPLFSADNWAPGDFLEVDLRVKNTGTLNIFFNLTFKETELLTPAEENGLEDQIFVNLNGARIGTVATYSDGVTPAFQEKLAPAEYVDFNLSLEFYEYATLESMDSQLPAFDISIWATHITNKSYIATVSNDAELAAALNNNKIGIIYLKNNTYNSQIVLTNKTITLYGESKDGVVITSPSLDVEPLIIDKLAGEGADYFGNVILNNSKAMIKNLTIQGDRLYNAKVLTIKSCRITNLSVVNSNAVIDNVLFTDAGMAIVDNGVQNGMAIYAAASDNNKYLTVTNSTLTRFQKAGLLVRKTVAYTSLINNEIIGCGNMLDGVEYINAQNGVQLAGSGLIENNTISNLQIENITNGSPASILLSPDTADKVNIYGNMFIDVYAEVVVHIATFS